MSSKQLFVKVLVGVVVLGGLWIGSARAAGQKAAAGSSASSPNVAGEVIKVDQGSITVRPKGADPVTVAFNDSTKVQVNGKDAKGSDVKVGMRAGAWFDAGQPAAKIYAYMPKSGTATSSPAGTEPKPDVFGTIVKLGNGSMTLQGSNNTQTVVTFNSATIVMISGSAAKASDLKVGMHAGAWVKSSQPATKINAYMPKSGSATSKPATAEPKADVFGTVVKVGGGAMTLVPKGDQTVTVAFNGNTVVIISGKAAKVSDLKVGMRAAAWVKASQPATKIYAYVPK